VNEAGHKGRFSDRQETSRKLLSAKIADHDLVTAQWVKVDLPREEFPGHKGEHVVRARERINFYREVSTRWQSTMPKLCR